MRKILLAVTGLSPQIVTETLYALAQQAEPWVPDEVHVITSREGRRRVELSLLDAAQGQFHALCRDYPALARTRFESSFIHTIADIGGTPLDDIRTPEDNARAADLIHEVVRNLTAAPDTALHVSIAGGRKTMGFYLGYCLSLTARPQDRLSHVLVSEPFEFLPDFYFPPKEARVLLTRDNRPVRTSDAQVMLAEIPFVRLRKLLPESVLASNIRFSDAVQATQAYLETPRIDISIARRELKCGGKIISMEPQKFAFYVWVARQAQDGQSEQALDDLDDVDFLRVYRQVVGEEGLSYEKAQAKFIADGGFNKEYLYSMRSRINALLKKSLGLRAEPYLIISKGKKPATRYGLDLPPSSIRLE